MDANGEAIEAVLMQGGHPAAFESKKLDHTHQDYLSYEQGSGQ